MHPMFPVHPLPFPPRRPPDPERSLKRVQDTIIVSSAIIIGLFVFCYAAGSLLDLWRTLNAGPDPYTTTITNAANAAPIATSTPIAPPSTTVPWNVSGAIYAPTLGGTSDDFLHTYAVVPGSRGLMYTATVAGQRVLIVLTLADPSQTLDGQPHVAIVNVRVPDDTLGAETWSESTADAIAQTFLPTDVTDARTVSTNGLRDHRYHSDAAEATFLADQFTNDPGTQTVPPGAVSYTCQPYPHLSAGYGQCVITIGSY